MALSGFSINLPPGPLGPVVKCRFLASLALPVDGYMIG